MDGWGLRVVAVRGRHVDSFVVEGAAWDKPRMRWGPFPTRALAEAHRARLEALEPVPARPSPAPRPPPRQWCPQCGRRLERGRCLHELCRWEEAS
jgi:hypothetical protein